MTSRENVERLRLSLLHLAEDAVEVAIARFLFDDESNRSRRRVFNLWTHYRDRNEKVGLFKLKGALCLSKSKWAAFHGPG